LDREESDGRVQATTEIKLGSGKQSRLRKRVERHESGREVLWTYADARRGILRQRKKRQYQGAMMGAGNEWIQTRIGIEVMEICCWKERRNRPERAKARTGSKPGSRKQSRKR
jgi:hypothetical protein